MQPLQLSLMCAVALLTGLPTEGAFDDITLTGCGRACLIGGIFQSNTKESASHAAFDFAFDPMMQRDWFGRQLQLRYRYEKVVEYVEDLEDSFQMSSAICRLISRGAIIIFGPVHYKTMPMVLSITDYFEVAYVTTSFVDKLPSDRILHRRTVFNGAADRRQPQGRFIVRLRPVITPAVVELIDHEKWERIFFLYDSKSALLRLREIFERYKGKESTISADIRDLTDGGPGAAATVLRYINDKSLETLKRVFLDLEDRSVQQQIFEEIKEIRGNRLDYHYLIMGSDINEVNQTMFLHGGVNITGFTVLNFSDPILARFKDELWFSQERLTRYPTSLDKLDPASRILPLSVALMIDGFSTFYKAHQKLQPRNRIPRDHKEACMPPETPAFPAENITGEFKGSRAGFAGITGWVQFDQAGYRENYRVQGIEAGVRSELQPISIWYNGQFRLTRNYSKSRTGFSLPFSNRTRIVTSILGEPFLMVRQNSSLDGTPLVGNDRFVGFCADLIKLLAKDIGFDYVIKPVADGRYGDDSVNDTWNGMIGELYRLEADIAVAPLTITSKREKVVDFSTPYMEVGLSIMFLKPTNPESDQFGFMKPLSKEIWMCIAFAYLGVSVVLFVVSRFSPYEWHLNQESDKADKVTNDFSIFNSLWFTLSAFMQQGGDISPRSLSGRIVGSVWWFFTLIIVSSYTANLAAFLTVERMSTPIQSYEDLAKQTKIKYGVVNAGSSKEFFRNSSVQEFRRMWQFMEANPNVFVNTVKEGVDRVLNSNNDYAFLLESTMNEYYSQQNCRTIKVGSNLDSGRGYGIATPSGSDLREIINLKVLQFKEKGEITRLKSTWWDASQCQDQNQDSKKSSAQSLELRSVIGLFYILIVGTVFGVILSIMEFVYRCALLAKRKKRNFKEVMNEMLILSTRGRIVLDCSTENADLIDSSVNQRFLK